MYYICDMLRGTSILLFFTCLIACQQSKSESVEPLDPTLVAFAGESYKDYIIEEIKPDPADTIQMIFFDQAGFVFDLKRGQKNLSHNFSYQNKGKIDSYIQDTWVLCNCIRDLSQKEILKPGQSGKLNITFDPSLWEPGESKTLTVYTRHFPHEIDLTIQRRK